MKMNLSKIASSVAVALLCAGGTFAYADESVTTTTTADGTISEFSPDAIVVHSRTESSPLRYSSSKTTTYVDESGAPVSREIIKSGAPVTIHYVKEGGRMIANRVIVQKTTTTTAPAATEEERTTTTTTTTK